MVSPLLLRFVLVWFSVCGTCLSISIFIHKITLNNTRLHNTISIKILHVWKVSIYESICFVSFVSPEIYEVQLSNSKQINSISFNTKIYYYSVMSLVIITNYNFSLQISFFCRGHSIFFGICLPLWSWKLKVENHVYLSKI